MLLKQLIRRTKIDTRFETLRRLSYIHEKWIYTDFSKTGANLTLPNVLSHPGDSPLIVRKGFIEVHFFDYHSVINTNPNNCND